MSRSIQDNLRVLAAYVRSRRDQPPTKQKALLLLAGLGIEGDCHLSSRSPRQVLLVSTGSYRRLAAPPNALRENLLIQADRLEWVSGSEIQIGPLARLRIMFECEPCAKLNRIRPGLLRASKGDRGILARVIQGGPVSEGDLIQVLPAVHPALSSDWRDRVLQVVDETPVGDLISYKEVAELAGVPTSYCRVFPRGLRLAETDGTAASRRAKLTPTTTIRNSSYQNA